MKKCVLSALALAAAAGSVKADPTVQFKIYERFSDHTVNSGDTAAAALNNTGNASDKTLWFVVTAKVSGFTPTGPLNDLNYPGVNDVGGISGVAGSVGFTNSTAVTGGASYKATAGKSVGNTSFVPASLSGYDPTPAAKKAIYNPFRIVSDSGNGGDGTVLGDNLTSISCAGGASGYDDAVANSLGNEAFGVENEVPIYTFQIDITDFSPGSSRIMTFATNFTDVSLFQSFTDNGVPNAILVDPSGVTQGSYTVTITAPPAPAPGSVALLGLGGLVAARRRRLA